MRSPGWTRPTGRASSKTYWISGSYARDAMNDRETHSDQLSGIRTDSQLTNPFQSSISAKKENTALAEMLRLNSRTHHNNEK